MQLGLIQNSSAHCYSSSVYIRIWLFLFQAFYWATRRIAVTSNDDIRLLGNNARNYGVRKLYIHRYSPKMVASIENKNMHTNKNIQ